jgi:hypothetical protein
VVDKILVCLTISGIWDLIRHHIYTDC